MPGQSAPSSTSVPTSPSHAGANSLFGSNPGTAIAGVNAQLLGMGGPVAATGIGGAANQAPGSPSNLAQLQRQLRIRQLQIQQQLLQQGASPEQAAAAVANNPLSMMNTQNAVGAPLGGLALNLAPGGGPLGGLPQPNLGGNPVQNPLVSLTQSQQVLQPNANVAGVTNSSPNASPTLSQAASSPQSGTTPATAVAQQQLQASSSPSASPVATSLTAAGGASPSLTSPGTPPPSAASSSSSVASIPQLQQNFSTGAAPQLGQAPQNPLAGLSVLQPGAPTLGQAPGAIGGMLSPRVGGQGQINPAILSGASTPVAAPTSGASSPRASTPPLLQQLMHQYRVIRANVQQLQQMAQKQQMTGQPINPAIRQRMQQLNQKGLQLQAQMQQVQQATQAQQQQSAASTLTGATAPGAAAVAAPAAGAAAPGGSAPPVSALSPQQVNGVLSQPLPSATNTQEFAKHFIMFQQVRMSLLTERQNLARKRTVLEEERKSLTDEHKRLVEISTMSSQQVTISSSGNACGWGDGSHRLDIIY